LLSADEAFVGFGDKGSAGTVMMTLPSIHGGNAVSERVPLRHYRLFSRQPYIELDGPVMRLRLPGIFGGRNVWNLNIADVAVVATEPSSSDDTGDDWVFEEPVNIPFAATTSPNVNPNLELLFKKPQRIPSLRVSGAQSIGLPYLQSRSSAGVHIDGLDLRAEDPVAAVETLAAAGMERVDRTSAWLRRHRHVTQDPALMKVAKGNDQRQRWVGAVVTVVVVLMIGLKIFGGDNPSNWELGAVGLALLVVFGLPIWARRRGARPLAAERRH
jgi:hypothetical protein